MNKIVLFAFMLLFLSSGVYALGITPGRTTFDYHPGESKTVKFDVVNSEHKNMNLVVLVQGELNQSISVSEVSFTMSADEETKSLSYILDIPNGLKPGPHESEVTVIQLPDKSATSEAFVGSALGVSTQIRLFVPYPGKYAEAQLNVLGPNENGEMIFAMPVTSRGDLDLVRVKGNIDVYNSLNEKITTINTNEVSILSGETKEVVAKWKPEVGPGTYKAVATLIYDEQTAQVEKQFNFGEKELELQQVEVNDFTLGGIAKFELLVQNKWNEAIKNAYAQVVVYNTQGEPMADFKSANYDIGSLEKVLMTAFWDTDGVKKGTYDTTVSLKYGEKVVDEDLQLEVKDNAINVIGLGYVISSDSGGGGFGGFGSSGLVFVLIIVIVVLVLVNLAWFLFIRRKLKKK